MLVDILTPVICRAGIGSAVTTDDRELLGEGREFYNVRLTAVKPTLKTAYKIDFTQYSSSTRSKSQFILVTNNTRILTKEGWLSPLELKNRASRLRCLKYFCSICHKLYYPFFPFLGACDRNCIKLAKKNGLWPAGSVSETSLNFMQEDWIKLFKVVEFPLRQDLDIVHIQEIKNGKGIYAKNILISNQELLV